MVTLYRSVIALTLCLLLISSSNLAYAATSGCCTLSTSSKTGSIIQIPGMGEISADYEGVFPDESGFTDTASYMTQIGVYYYYRLNGYWPNSWQDVVNQGIYQVPLTSYLGDNINPDDASLDFVGDVCYYPASSEENTARLFQLTYNDGAYVKVINIEPPNYTYEEFLPMLDERKPEWAEKTAHFLNDEAEMLRFAILGMISKCLTMYYIVYGDYPKTWDEFIESGLSPVDGNSVNPLTGGPFFGDGRPNDIYYKYVPVGGGCGENEHSGYKLLPVDAEGKVATSGFSY